MLADTKSFVNDLSHAEELDKNDPLASFRSKFLIPQHNGKDTIYFCGNSLGLQPKNAREYVEQEMKDWELHGVEGHFKARYPWFPYHNFLTKSSMPIVGAKSELEVVVMNSLSVNLNLLLISFYQPNDKRNKIVIEEGAFPSDFYAVEQQIRFHGYDPAECIIELKARDGEHTLRTEDILATLDDNADEIATVMLGGINYYTGQYFDLESITAKGHEIGAFVGFDLAHAAGNVKLELHDWDVDFACWCTYKYLNSGPGGTSGIFVHEKFANDKSLPKLAGWWGNDENTRFKMPKHFEQAPGASSWQMSNAQILPMALHRASLAIFEEAGMDKLREKSIHLTNFLEFLIKEANRDKDLGFEIITPEDPKERGAQLSLLTSDNGKALYHALTDNGVVADWREPNVIRIAPVPLYNTYSDVFNFVDLIKMHA